MSTPIALYCKSYHRDVQRVRNLLDSVILHNVDRIPFYVSVPASDRALFERHLGSVGHILITDEEILGYTPVDGWDTQQVVKMSVWKTGLASNYVILDSDSYFIRPFHRSDFLADEAREIPYTVMHEQKELFAWTCNKTAALGFDPQLSFAECRLKVMDIFGQSGKVYDFGPSPVIWNASVFKAMEAKYLAPNNLTMASLIQLVPSEFSWYGCFLMADKTVPIIPCEPLMKVFHYPQQYIEMKQQGYTEAHLAKVFTGIIMQGNWQAPLRF